MMLKSCFVLSALASGMLLVPGLKVEAQTAGSSPLTLTINAAKVTAPVSPTLYGLMTEEINHAYDGGLYAELIQNRIFKDDPKQPVHWSVVQKTEGSGSIELADTQHLNDSLTVCLKLDAQKASNSNRIGVANDGYWGIPVRPKTTYQASFYAKAQPGFTAPLIVSIEGADGKVFAEASVKNISSSWKKYTTTLTTGADVVPSVNNRLVIAVNKPGTLWFNLVSLFPPTYNNRINGNRVDIMQKLADLHPTFLRCPGGNYVEGSSMPTFYNWKKTIHDLSVRPGHPGTWKYRSSDGLGILEYMEWCEDLKIQPVLAVFAGYTLNKQYIEPGPALTRYVNDALDEIEYITGDASTTWGAQRIADGHPAPFALNYVEIGNEDFFDRSGSYDGRFAQFFDAIKAKYPKLQIIATTKIKSRTPDLLDEHFYKRPQDFENDIHHYDPENYKRDGYKVFVGEWAARTGASIPTPNLECALGDAAWMTGMERNSDLILMASYAPLFVNVNPGAMQWRINMIGYDAMDSYGSPSYYAQKMFYENLGDAVIAAEINGVPDVPYIPAPPRRPANTPAPAATTTATATAAVPPPPPAPQFMPSISYTVTKNSKTGLIFLKIVNIKADVQAIQIKLEGVNTVEANGTAITLSGKPEDTNSITEPAKVVPVTTQKGGLGKSFTYLLEPNSVTVLKIQTK